MGALDCVNAAKMSPTESTEVFTINKSSTSLDQSRRDLESQRSKLRDDSKRHSIWWHVVIDIPLLILVFAVVGLLELGLIPSHKAGFYCNDPTLSFPFAGDTVTAVVLMPTLFFMPYLLILITELLFSSSEESFVRRASQANYTTLFIIRAYCYGLFMNLLIVEVIKIVTGSPRPTFFDLCKPDTSTTCNGSEYVSTFTCTSSYSTWLQSDASHSFPSGHTSMSVYCGFFIVWYLQRRAFDWRQKTVFLVPVLQLLAITYAVICSLTRITDHRHHWWDVLAGTVVGFATLAFSVLVLCDNFKDAITKGTSELSMEDNSRSLLFQGRRTNIL